MEWKLDIGEHLKAKEAHSCNIKLIACLLCTNGNGFSNRHWCISLSSNIYSAFCQ